MIYQTRVLICFGSICITTLVGCGGGTAPAPSEANTTQQTASQQTTSATQQTEANNSTATVPKVDPNRKETKWIGDIPYDVFYDQPLTIAADATVIGGTPTQNTSVANNDAAPAAMSSDTPAATTSTPPSSSGGGSIDWESVMPMTVLQSEVKNIRTRLTTNLQTVATYNRNAEAIALDGAMISALGAIVTVHPNADSWKDRGKFVRDLGYEIYSNSGESGRAAFESVEEPFLKMQTALDGGTVDGVDAEEVVPFADVVYVSEMMKRIESTYNNLKANINTEARLKEDPEGVEREARMLAALGAMMGHESYDNSDAKPYQGFVKQFVDGAMKSAEAVKAQDYESFRDGLNSIQTTCAECHQQYRGSESGF